MLAWEEYHRYQISPEFPQTLRQVDIYRLTSQLKSDFHDALDLEQIGRSLQQRPILMMKLGSGPIHVLAWSQMHGDEPTHTAALLDLVQFLMSDPEHPLAEKILEACTLFCVPMLDPDGAERWARRNAQDIDINRDALHLQTPEGKLLQSLVKRIRPDFALNLHNQRPRTTVTETQQVASLSLLVPPVDQEDSNLPHVDRAKRLAGYVANAIAPYSPSPISRYNADYMPRCFGEWIQQQGASTLTIEAGGWPSVEAKPLVQLHFHALVACYYGIAERAYANTPLSVYQHLPRTGEHDLFDVMVQAAQVQNGTHAAFRADLGINFEMTFPHPVRGKLVDLGDLCVTTGKQVHDASRCACIPGRIAFVDELTPNQLPKKSHVELCLQQGVTTVIGQIDLSDAAEVEAFLEMDRDSLLPLNIGFLARLDRWETAVQERLLRCIGAGVLGALSDDLPEQAAVWLESLRVPVVSLQYLPSLSENKQPAELCARQTHRCAELLQLTDRGVIQLLAAADLCLISTRSSGTNNTVHFPRDLHQVLIGGNVVFQHGQPIGTDTGQLLIRKV